MPGRIDRLAGHSKFGVRILRNQHEPGAQPFKDQVDLLSGEIGVSLIQRIAARTGSDSRG